MTSRQSAAALPAVLALVFFAFHLPYFPKSLEDLDSVNFALGVRAYNVAEHQPHPPGYPLYILIAKGINAIVGSEPVALSAFSIIAGALAVVLVAALAVRILGGDDRIWPNVATLLAITSPLYWFTAARPLTDVPGLAAAIGVQVMTLAATTPRALVLASFCAALATGLQSQIAWLTVPLLVLRVAQGSKQTLNHGVVESLKVALAFVAGVLIWAVPLVVITGGPRAYWAALSFQGSADLGNIQMLWTRHGARDVADALYYAFVAPWAVWPSAAVVLLLALVGAVALLWRKPASALVLAAAFGPYLAFDLLFQETFTSRYTLPLVIPMAVLAAAGASVLPWRLGAIVAILVAMANAHAGGTSVAAFAREKAPAFRLIDDLRAAPPPGGELPVLAMDRKQAFDFRRPFVWMDGALPVFGRVLLTPPQHEWLEAAAYWAGGGRAPVWFVVDPKRTMIDLVQHGDPVRYRWPLPHPVLISGARPDEMDLYRVTAPDWFVGAGWALTPEVAGIADADGRGPSTGPIMGWLTRRVSGGALMIGGRNFSPDPATVTIDAPPGLQELLPAFPAPPGAFVRLFPLTAAQLPPGPDYLQIAVRASPGTRVAIEQFDAAPTRPVFGYGAGWQEQEFNPRTGERWRWLSEHGELRFATPTPRLTLHLTGDDPKTYFSRGSRLVARAGDRVIFDQVLTSAFSLDLPVPDGIEVVTLETDQVFQPADRSRRSADRRHLGLRIFTCEVRPVS